MNLDIVSCWNNELLSVDAYLFSICLYGQSLLYRRALVGCTQGELF